MNSDLTGGMFIGALLGAWIMAMIVFLLVDTVDMSLVEKGWFSVGDQVYVIRPATITEQ